ncbi:predicted protein [Naegleria gruberi]|uniref:Predicted protein n=1 Tax=Naegleria gruberi TaxID=5762 RepID=D2VFG5_NAEGR|nr:uncharacterized protein NAEGRDRAFT_67619 [Naegleria gruberi]EFC44460.1 predicted protein [Naegleria gruberi]|eukprot:XP_002677204.1 predicted protein [Naegleria gruberi strain NEG-M]
MPSKQCHTTPTSVVNDRMKAKNEFSFMINDFGVEFFVGYFMAEFFHPKELIMNFTILNRNMRKLILQNSKLWKKQFEYMYPNLIGLIEDWIQMKLWNDEREERIRTFLKDDSFWFKDLFSNTVRKVEERDFNIVKISCKSQMVHFMSSIIMDHMFCETNFNSEYTWNQNSLSSFKYHRVQYSIYLKIFKLFYLLTETRQLGNTNNTFLMDIINQVNLPNKSIKRLFKNLVTDLNFKSSCPCSAYFLFSRGYSGKDRFLREEQEGIHSLPYVDFSMETGLPGPSFRVYPHVPLDKIDSEVKEFDCTIVSTDEEYSLVYPRDSNRMISLFESYCASIDETYYSFVITGLLERYLGLDSYIGYVKDQTVFHHHFRRSKCVNPSTSARIYFQSQVDKYAKHVFESFKGNGISEEFICNQLAKFPSKSEVEHLLQTPVTKLFESVSNPNDANEYMKNFESQRTKLKNSYRGTFKVDGFLIRAIDKCLRRYLYLYVFCEPTLSDATKSCSFTSSKFSKLFSHFFFHMGIVQKPVYNQMKNIVYPIYVMLLPHVSNLISFRIEQFIGKLSNEELREKQQAILNGLDHCFEQLNFLNVPLIDLSE